MLLIEIKGLDPRLLTRDVVDSMNAIREREGRLEVYRFNLEKLAATWEVEVESALDKALCTSGLPGLNDEARINFDLSRWRLTRAQRVVVIVRLWTDLDWTYDLRLKMLGLIGRNLSNFLPVDWHLEALTQSRGDDAHLFARAGSLRSLRDGDAAPEDDRA